MTGEQRAFRDPDDPDNPATLGRILGFNEHGPIYSGLGGIVPEIRYDLDVGSGSFAWGIGRDFGPRPDSEVIMRQWVTEYKRLMGLLTQDPPRVHLTSGTPWPWRWWQADVDVHLPSHRSWDSSAAGTVTITEYGWTRGSAARKAVRRANEIRVYTTS